jgi:tetratricopeptide (TPR) repeat protein
MRRFIILFAMLLGVALVQSLSAPSAEAGWGHHGWGHHGWGHRGWGWGHHRYYGGWGGYYGRNWGFGRGYVYRPIYRPWYGYRGYYGGYGGYGYNAYYPAINYGYYPSYGYSTYYDNCYPVYQTYSSPIYYDTRYSPTTTLLANGNVSSPLTNGTTIAQLAEALRNQRSASGGQGITLGNGRLRGVVQNIVGGVIQNQPVNANTINVRTSNLDARSKARAYMTQGDNLFREQRYAAAAQQYRAAASMAPDLAEANWRYSHTLVAMGEYDLAVNAVNRALAASSDIGRNGFTLDTLYGDVGTAKTSHLESLANRALETDSPNAYFLLGMTLHYSGEAVRAEKFFAKAAEVQSGNPTHIAAFVPAVKKPVPAPPPLLARLPANET